MSPRAISLGLTALSVASLAVALLIDVTNSFPWVIPMVTSLVVGAILTYRMPENRVGWLLLAFGAGGSIPAAFDSIANVSADQVLAAWVETVGAAINTATVVFVIGDLFLRFPEGRLLSRRWRFVEYVLVVAALTGAAAALLNGGWAGDVAQATYESPLREATAPLGDVLAGIFYVSSVGWVLCAIAAIIRYRRSEGEERLQMKWLAYAAGLLILVNLIELGISLTSGEMKLTSTGLMALGVALTFSALPIAIAIAVLKYRLYDIDIVISRTVGLATLAGFITLVYALVVVGIGNVIGGDADGLLLPIAATAIVALAFEPVRHMAQGWANRLVYGQRATPYEVLSDLTERLSHGEEGEGLLARMAARLGDGTGAERATIWLGDETTMVVGASWPEGQDPSVHVDLDAEHVFPVTHDGVVVGALEVVKARGTALSTAERSLIGDLAGSAGAVLGYQRLNDSLEAKAQELAESRGRLVDAQDRERRRLERDLHDGAQQLIVALKVKIGLARAMAEKHGAADLESLLDGLGNEAQGALDEVRALAKGIYPPVLESDGLGSALSALASGSSEEVVVSSDGISRYPRDIEAAVYFEISEAVTNAVKHGSGPIAIELRESEGQLFFSVEDSGPGFDVASANGGSGLQNLRDRMDAVDGRLEILSEVGAPTIVRGSVPLETVSV